MVIVDSSIVIKWYFDEVGSDAARALLREPDFGAPDLLRYEFANYLACSTLLPLKESESLLDKLSLLPVQFFSLPQTGFKAALKIAREFRLSFYDATFVTLADSLKTDLITADRKLIQKVKSLSFVHLLG